MTTYYRRVRRKYGKPTTMKQSRIVYEPVAEPLLTRAEWLATIDYEAAAEALRMVRAFTAEEAKPVVDAALRKEEQ